MLSSESIGEVATALSAFQGAIPNIGRNRSVSVATKKGGAYRFRYATLDEIRAAIRQPLADNGLSVVHVPGPDENGRLSLETRVIHCSGEWFGCVVPIKVEGDGLQALGSALTYLQRYSLCSLLGITADEDDDGNRAEGNRVTDVPTNRRQQAPTPVRLRDQIIASIAREPDSEKMGSYTARINERLEQGKLTAEEAHECRAQVAARIVELGTSKPSEPAPTGKLFDPTEVPEGVGV